MGVGGTAAVTVLGVSVPRDRLIIPSVAALSAPAHTVISNNNHNIPYTRWAKLNDANAVFSSKIIKLQCC